VFFFDFLICRTDFALFINFSFSLSLILSLDFTPFFFSFWGFSAIVFFLC